MAEYIKREDAKKAILEACGCDSECKVGCNGACDIHAGSVWGAVDNIPAADVVEVVRCRDCKYATMTYDGLCKYCEIHSPNEAAYYDGDFYCAYGERSENND